MNSIYKIFKYSVATGLSGIGLTLFSLSYLPPDKGRLIYSKLLAIIDWKFQNEEKSLYIKYILNILLLKLNCLPLSEYQEGKIVNKSSLPIFTIGNEKVKLPFGLSEFDVNSLLLPCLSRKIGFDFIENGNCKEVSHHKSTTYSYIPGFKYDEKTKEIKYSSNVSIGAASLVNIDNIQNYLCYAYKKKLNPIVCGLNIRISNDLLNYVPYLLKDIILDITTKTIGSAGFITIDLSNPKGSYENLLTSNEFDSFLSTLTSTLDQKHKDLLAGLESNRQTLCFTLKSKPSLYIKLSKINNDLLASINKYSVDGIILESSYVENDYIHKNGSKSKELLLNQLELINSYKKIKPFNKHIITNGAVNSGNDIKEYYNKGADFVLINSLLMIEGPYCIDRLIKELNI